MKLIDVSVPLDGQLSTHPSHTPVSLEPMKRLAQGGSSNVSSLHWSAHAGTHVDAPFQFFDAAAGTEALALDILMGPASLVELTTRKPITADDLAPLDLSQGIRLLIKTHNSELCGAPASHPDYVGMFESGGQHAVNHGVKLVGVDDLSIEAHKTPGAPAHHLLLGAGGGVVEGLNLRDIAQGIHELICQPLCVVGSDGAPARVVLQRS